MCKCLPEIMRDSVADEISKHQRRTELFGTPVPEDEWIGPGAEDEFRNGRGSDDDGK